MNDSANQIEPPVQPKSWFRREWRLLIGFALSAICIYLAVQGISIQAIGEALSAARWEWVVLAIGVVVAGTLLKAMRWRALFFPQHVSLGKVWSIFMVGQMLNVVLPARAGEIGRVYLVGEEEAISRAKALSTIIVEKMVDLVMLALAYLLVALWLTTTQVGQLDWLRQAGASLLPLAFLALGGLLLFAYTGRPAWRFLRRMLNPLSLPWQAKANAAVEQALGGFEVLRRWQTSVQVWGLSFLVWTFSALTNMLIFSAFQLPLFPFVALLLLVVLMSGIAVSPLPGNLGVLPFLCQLILSLFGIDRETALIYGIVLQMVTYLPLVILGSVCMLRENWSLQRSSASSGRLGHNNLPNQ